MIIDCDECRMQGTDQCRDCVVSFVVRDGERVLHVDANEARALRELGRAGLVPLLRLAPRGGAAGGGERPERAAG